MAHVLSNIHNPSNTEHLYNHCNRPEVEILIVWRIYAGTGMRSVKFFIFSSRSILSPEAFDSDLSLDLNEIHYLSNETVTGVVSFTNPPPPIISGPKPKNNGPPSVNLRARGGTLLAATLNT